MSTTLVLFPIATKPVSTDDIRDVALHSIDLGLGHLEDDLLRAGEGDYPTELLVKTCRHLSDLHYDQLDFCSAHRRSLVGRQVEDYLVDVIEELELLVHGNEWSSTDEERMASGECLGCDKVIPLFIKAVMDKFGIQRATLGKGRRKPSDGLYCRRNPRLLRKLLRQSWPGIELIPAPVERWSQRLDPWELDPNTRSVLKEIEHEVLYRSDRFTSSLGQIRRSYRLALRRVLRRRRRSGSVADLDVALIRRHPLGWAFAREGWPGFISLPDALIALPAVDSGCGDNHDHPKGVVVTITHWCKSLILRLPFRRDGKART